MKELLIDFTMVGLLLFCMNGLLNNHYIQMKWFLKNIVAFEQNVQKQKKLIQMKVSAIIKKIIHFFFNC